VGTWNTVATPEREGHGRARHAPRPDGLDRPPVRGRRYFSLLSPANPPAGASPRQPSPPGSQPRKSRKSRLRYIGGQGDGPASGIRLGLYVLDEPTTGLHLADVEHLLGLLDRLVDSAKSVIVIEHHQAVMAHADWIIDLGPGAGHDGGRIVFEGTPADLVAARSTLTGEHLAAYIGT